MFALYSDQHSHLPACLNLIKILPGSHHHHYVQVRELGCSWEVVGLEPPVHAFHCPHCSLFRHQEKWCLLLSLWTPSLPGWNLSHTEGLPRWAVSHPSIRALQPLPTTLPSGVPLPTQPQAATTQAGESSSMNREHCPQRPSLCSSQQLLGGRQKKRQSCWGHTVGKWWQPDWASDPYGPGPFSGQRNHPKNRTTTCQP